MSCPPPPPIVDNTAALAKVSATFGTGPTCESNGGGVGYEALFGLIKFNAGVKSSKGCSAISKQLSYLSQANTVSACQLNRSASSSSQTSIIVNSIDFFNGPGGQVLCGPGGFNLSNVTEVNFQLSVQLDSEATQSIAATVNELITNLLTAKAESNQGYLATSDGLQVFQAAIADTKNYIQTTNVNDTYINMFQSTETTNIIKITNYGLITGDSCNITNSNLNTLTASQLMQTLANQAASLQSVVDFNSSFDAYVADNTAGLDSLSSGSIAGIVIAVFLIVLALCLVGWFCRTGTCTTKPAEKPKPKPEEGVELTPLQPKPTVNEQTSGK